MSKLNWKAAIILAGALAFAGAANAGESANRDEATAMVKKAVSFIKEQGAEKAYAEISNKAGRSSIAIFTSSSTSSTARCSRTVRTRSSSART